ncbi:MAG TPA: type 1 glutamine amidotransferase domain-containing protein [Polyangia bacterium]|jgi:protease I|nr:type 1 glutamine amidotransferase domain-containing protein [Polyangia bacterium]
MRIACVLAEGFEDSEFKKPYDAFRDAGHEVVIVGKKKGEKLEGKQGKEKTKADIGIDEARPDEYHALFIPGGHSPDMLRTEPKFVELTRAFADKPILAICHGPQLLMTAGMVKDRRMTAWKTVQVDLKYAGANVVDEEVVVDGNLVTSRRPDDIPAFIERSLEMLRQSAERHADA